MFILANVIQEAFSPLISVFQSILVFIHTNITTTSWGLAIVGLTVLIRAVLVPLTLKQFRSMQELQRLAPQLKELQEKYKDDKQRQQQEVMGFYKEHKVNPFASCLPLLLQLPVFISLFYMLRTDLKKHLWTVRWSAITTRCTTPPSRHFLGCRQYVEQTGCQTVAPGSAKFLFIPDITSKATGVALVVLLVLYVGSQLVSTMTMSATADPTQRRLMMALPLFFVIILYKYPAGLLVYWITTNLWTVGQGYFVRRSFGPPPVSVGKGVSPPGTGKAVSNGKPEDPRGLKGEPALAGAGVGSVPPPPPRKKKKRSGRRR